MIMEEILQSTIQEPKQTTTPDTGNSQSSSWWSGWGLSTSLIDKTLDKVKQQSEHIINIYKEDLKEFTQTIQTDTKEVIKKLPQEQEKLTELLGLSSKGDKSKSKGLMVDRQKSRLISLQTELSTYCTDPSETEEFESFKKDFQIGTRTEEISQLLSTNEKVREIHTKLVPMTVSYKDFWERYFFKLNKLKQEEARRAALVKKATTTGQEEEEIRWDAEDDSEATSPRSDTQSPEKTKEVEQYLEKLEDKSEPPKSEEEKSEPVAPAQQTSAPQSPTPTKEPTPAPTTQKQHRERKADDMEEDWDNWE